MKPFCWSLAVLWIVFEGANAAVPDGAKSDASFAAFLPRFEESTSQFVNGDPSLWKQFASRREDATIMGGWGAFEKGWSEVGARYDWAAARFQKSEAQVSVEYLSSGVSGDLAYTVAIETSKVLLLGQSEPAVMPLRVTHVFRKEQGEWKLVHRHADPVLTKTEPKSVLQK